MTRVIDPDKPPLLLLGIDGGGTKTSALLAARRADAQLATIGRGESGPSNPRAAGWDAALRHIDEAVDAAFAAAGRPRQRVAALCLAVAGAGHAAVRARFDQWCATRGLADARCIVTDAQIVVRAGRAAGTAIALIAGTGSLAYGRTPAGESARAGGWGHLLGDEGSGYAVGLSALRAAARAVDRRGPETQLTSRLRQHLRIDDPWELIPIMYEDPEVRQHIARFAPEVFAAAAAGDRVACDIVGQAARDLAAMVRAVAKSLACAERGYQLIFSGGLLRHHAALRDAVLQDLAEQHCSPHTSLVVHDPTEGALLLANDLAV